MKPYYLHNQLVHIDNNAVHIKAFCDLFFKHRNSTFKMTMLLQGLDGVLSSEAVDINTSYNSLTNYNPELLG
jgi:hypothetical protein